jgi:hypothetical protein
MVLKERLLRRIGVPKGERLTCRAWCQGCGLAIYAVEGLPEGSRGEVERLLSWMRENTGKEHRRTRGCRGFKLRWEWERFAPRARHDGFRNEGGGEAEHRQ